MNILVIGGGGPVGIAFLAIAEEFGWRCTVVDPIRPKRFDRRGAGGKGAAAIDKWIRRRLKPKTLALMLAEQRFDAVIDLAPTLDKIRAIDVCDAAGVSMVNSTMVDFKDDIHVAAYNFVDDRPEPSKRAHIVAAGMNPGALNAMAEEIIAQHGVPDEILFWEYDNSAPASGGFQNAMTTWCVGESHDEITNDWAFDVPRRGAVNLYEDSLSLPVSYFRDLAIPHDQVQVPPQNEVFLCGHEECVYLAWRHNTSVKFMYGLHPDNMRLIRAAGFDGHPDLLVNQPAALVDGRDVVGVACRYDRFGRWFGQYCIGENTPATPTDTNATCHLVAAGMAAGVLTVTSETLPVDVHLTHEVPAYLGHFRKMVATESYQLPINSSQWPAIARAV